MSATALPRLPDSAKQVLPFMLRAQEMDSRDPAIAYWCKMHAARVALQVAPQIPEIRPWLLAIMDALEAEKLQLKDNEFVADENVAAAHVENFALKIFAAADREDRAGKASMRTAKTFLAASNYLDVLSVFSDADLDESVKDKIKYAKFKATDIIKALKAGEVPRPGPPPGSEAEAMDQVIAASAANSSSSSAGIESPTTPTNPVAPPPQLPSMPTPGVFPGLDHFHNHLPPPAQPPTFSTGGPASAHFNPTAPELPPARSPYPSSAAAPSPASSAPSFPAIPSFNPLPSHNPPPLDPNVLPSPLPAMDLPDPKLLAQAQKHARFAISALEYDDVNTAMDNLRKAMAVLAPFERRK
ncbi:Vta1 like-domain-containing protein [Catenaria anguillulae PL171]|uniref:Vta1 like-domain-containing protein n=1 Tax=Catenaria anguillulae PL171 TaxID=765915 RepID=A0A1Y2HBD1_9FUNG|nr:Vta1 like-domain-containing protein [Catenaria anguillulae PL171]